MWYSAGKTSVWELEDDKGKGGVEEGSMIIGGRTSGRNKSLDSRQSGPKVNCLNPLHSSTDLVGICL